MKKGFIVLLLVMLMVTPLFAQGSGESSKTEAKEVYFLNFKPEVAEVYADKVAPAFEQETGIKLKVVTAASGTYAQQLKSEMAKGNPPAIFQTNGPVGLANSKDDCLPLNDTKFYSLLSDKSLALRDGDNVLAVPYVVEGYGIIVNNAIMNKYFALSNKATTVNSLDEIRNFDTLKAVVEDMQANKAALGIDGVFASTSMASGNQWRWQTHLFNIALYKEFKDSTPDPVTAALNSMEFDFAGSDEFKSIFDLYINNSTVPASLLGAKSVDDSMAEFALGKCAMVQNGTWGAGQILGLKGNVVAAEDIVFLPIYSGIENEEHLGLCIGTENYLCINKNVSKAQQEYADTFLEWLFSSDTGRALIKNDLGFVAPFTSIKAEDLPDNPLTVNMAEWMEDGSTSIPWVFAGIPSEHWKDSFGSNLYSYAQGKMTWDQVKATAIKDWKVEKELAAALN